MSFNVPPIAQVGDRFGSTASDLLAAAKRHDESAWKELVARYSWLVYRWGRQEGLDADAAADVLQVVMTQVWTHLQNFEKDGKKASFRRWLRAITRSKVAAYRRSRAGQPRAEGGSDALARLNQVPGVAEDSDACPVCLGDRLDELWRILNRIERDFQESTWQAFWLTVIENQTSNEAAQALGISPGAVRIAKCRVLNRLRSEGRLHSDRDSASAE